MKNTRRPRRVCAIANCPQLAEAGKSYCAGHGRALAKHHKKSNPFSGHYSGRAWRTVRAKHLKSNPHCVICGATATDVDHVVPLRFGGTDDENNLRSMCHSCHSRHTSSNGGGFGNKVKL